MYSLIPIKNNDYPNRLYPDKLYYSEYKEKRPFYFYKNNNTHTEDCKDYDPLVPHIENFKDKISFITNEYILNSLKFEWCDYFIDYIEGEEINSAMLPINPYSPTGIGGLGTLKKWGPNQFAHSIIISFDNNNNCFQLLIINKNNNYSLPTGEINCNDIINYYFYKNLKDIIDINNAKFVYSGYLNSSKNTDHAWIEITVYLFILNNSKRMNLLNYIKNNSYKNFKLINLDKEDPDYKLMNINDMYFLNMVHNFI